MTNCDECGFLCSHGVCPRCDQWKFIGHGPLCVDCVTDPDAPATDAVNNPAHYTWLGGIEVIDITEHLSFTLGNVVKYVLRADHKGKPIEDLRKAAWYLDREIARREANETA